MSPGKAAAKLGDQRSGIKLSSGTALLGRMLLLIALRQPPGPAVAVGDDEAQAPVIAEDAEKHAPGQAADPDGETPVADRHLERGHELHLQRLVSREGAFPEPDEAVIPGDVVP